MSRRGLWLFGESPENSWVELSAPGTFGRFRVGSAQFTRLVGVVLGEASAVSLRVAGVRAWFDGLSEADAEKLENEILRLGRDARYGVR